MTLAVGTMRVVSDADSLMARGAAIFDQIRSSDPDAATPASSEAESAELEEAEPTDGDTDSVAGAAPDLPEASESSDLTTSESAPDDGSVTDAAPADLPVSSAPTEPESPADASTEPPTGPSTEASSGSSEEPSAAAPPEAETAALAAPAPPATPKPATPKGPRMPDEVREVVHNVVGDEPRPSVQTPERRDAAGNRLPRIMAVANQKGGVGKTTTAVNLGAALADVGYRTLVVDLDPQGNASTGLGINIRDLELSMYDVVIHEASIDDTIEATSMKNLFVAPASLDLAGAEIELVPAFSRELRLRHALAEVEADYDYVLIDCPPSLGLLTVNGLAAAGEVLVPIQCEYYALEGLGQLLRNVALVQRNLNQRLEVSTVVCVMYDARTKLADQVVAEVREHFGEKVARIVVPRTVRLSEAPSYGQPILAFDPRSRGAIAYRELAREVSGGARD